MKVDGAVEIKVVMVVRVDVSAPVTPQKTMVPTLTKLINHYELKRI